MKNAVRWIAIVCALALVAGAAIAQEPAKVAGKWELTWEGRNGTQTSAVTFEQDGEKLKGTISGPRGESPFEGSIKGKDITFSVKRQTPNGEFVQEFKGTVDGDTMKGTFSMGQRTVDWTGKRAK